MVRQFVVRCGCAFSWVGCLLVLAPSGLAEEPARQFLDALRQRGYDDTALEYLEMVKDHPGVPVIFRVAIPFERGVSVRRMAAREANFRRRSELLGQAEALLNEFVQKQPGHPSVIAARRELGSVLLLRGDLKREMADAEGRPELKKEALADLDAAKKVFDQAAAELKERLDNMKAIPEGETSLLAMRKRLRDEQLETLLESANLMELRSEIFPESSPDHAKALREAAKAYEVIYQEYRRKVAGAYARFYQARCLAKAGDLDHALAILETDVLAQPGVRDLKTQAITLAIQTWSRPEQKKFKEGVRRGREWLATQLPNERRTPRWLEFRLTLAEAMTEYAEVLKSDPKSASARSELLRGARSLARDVGRIAGPLRARAKALLERLPGATKLASEDELPDSLEDTEKLISEAFDAYTTLNKKITTQHAAASAESDATKRAALQKEIDQLSEQVAATLARTEQLVRHALNLGGEKMPVEKRTRFLYQLAFLKQAQHEPYDTYVLGWFVASRFPDVSLAKSSASLALKASLQLYDAADPKGRMFESDLVRRTTAFIIETWSDTPEAEEAINVAVQFEILEGNLEAAETLARRLPDKSPYWADAWFRVGQAYWSRMARQRKTLDADARAAAAPKFKAMRQKVIGLIAGPAESLKEVKDYDLLRAQAILDLAMAYVEEGQADKAMVWLDDPRRGLLALARSDHASGFPALFPLAVYQTSLRALVGTMASAGGSQADAEKRMRELMAELQSRLGSDATGQRRLISLYVSLAGQLKDDLASKPVDQRKPLALPLAQLLEAVTQTSQDPTHLRWAAKVLRDVAESLKGLRTTASLAVELDQRAVKILQRTLKLAAEKPGWMDGPTEDTVRYQLALAQQSAGQFSAAAETFRDLLKTKPTMLSAQSGAAQAFQQWAMEEQRGDLMEKAIRGAFPDAKGKNIVWGWSRLATITMRYPKFRSVFHQARYQGAVGYYMQARWSKNSGVKKEKLRTARQVIAQTYQLFPELGGKEWRSRYDALLQSIQRELGESPTGLNGLRSRSSGKRGSG